MTDLKKKYPGTVVAVVDKNSPTFREDFKAAIDEALVKINLPLHEKIKEKIKAYGTAVSCCRPDGYMIEGNIVDVLPYGFEPEWTEATVVVRNHEDGSISNWRPAYVTFIGRSSSENT